MAEPFIGQIIHVPFTYAPRGYAYCNGQLLSIASNQALFSILGTTYGGDGRTTFALPNLQGRVPIGSGQGPGLSNRILGATGGEDAHTLVTGEIAAHNHTMYCDSQSGAAMTPGGNLFAQEGSGSAVLYSDQVPNATMNPNAIGNTGGNQPHLNVMPTIAISFCIATQGIYPSRN